MTDREVDAVGRVISGFATACVLLLMAGIPLAALVALVKFIMWMIGA